MGGLVVSCASFIVYSLIVIIIKEASYRNKHRISIKFDSKYEAEKYIQEHELKPYIREDLDDIMAVPEKEEPTPSNADC